MTAPPRISPDCRRRFILAATTDIEEPHLEEFRAWHDSEHLPERIGLDGFLRGRRYINCGAGPKFLILYDIADAQVFTSAPYLARLNNPTAWSQRCLTFFHGTTRSFFEVTQSHGVIDTSEITLHPHIGRADEIDTRDPAKIAAVHGWAQILSLRVEACQIRTREMEIFGNGAFREDLLLCGHQRESSVLSLQNSMHFVLERSHPPNA